MRSASPESPALAGELSRLDCTRAPCPIGTPDGNRQAGTAAAAVSKLLTI